MAASRWCGPGAGMRMALLTGAGIGVFVVAGWFVDGELWNRWPYTVATLIAYLMMVGVLAVRPGAKSSPRVQARATTILMTVMIPASAVVSGVTGLAPLLLIPAVHAALCQDKRDFLATAVACAALWLLLRNLHGGFAPEWFVWSCVELLPFVLALLVVRSLGNQLSDSENQLTALSYRDELTGLLNMRAFTRLLQTAHRQVADGEHYALLMVDIEHLQVFNDRFGHEQGNRVIKAVADAIRRSTRHDDRVARYGGDEFVIYLPGAGDDIAEVVSNRIAQNVYNITLSFDSKMQRVSVNIGRAIYPESGRDLQDMLSFANRAMCRDKEFRRRVAKRKSGAEDLRRQAGVDDWR